jgi:DNA-binding GntR family transcriptional regulator
MTYTTKIPLKNKIIDYIYDAIVKEKYTYGTKIREIQLAKKLNCSRAPIREALQELVSLGVLEQLPHKGVYVKEITSKDIFDTYEAKGVIEGFLATSFSTQATPKDINRLNKYIKQMLNSANNRKQVVKNGELFHKYTLKYAKNNVLLETLEKINKKSQILFYKNWTKLYTVEEVTLRHQKIVEALISKNKQNIENTLKEHYFETGTKIVILKEIK